MRARPTSATRLALLILLAPAARAAKRVDITIDTAAPIHTVDRRYASANLDWWGEHNNNSGGGWAGQNLLKLDLSNRRLRGLAAGLSPGYLRLGGSLDTYVKYDLDGTSSAWCNAPSRFRNQSWHLCLNASRWDEINAFASEARLELVVGMNFLTGADGKYNASQAAELLSYSKKRGYRIGAFELGEEMEPKPGTAAFEALIAGYRELRSLIRDAYPHAALLGPCVGMPLEDNSTGYFGFMRAFLNETVPDVIDGVCMHSYNNDGGHDWASPGFLKETAKQASSMLYETRLHSATTPLWCGECGPHNFGGIPNITNAFFSSFWYLDALGGLAAMGFHQFGRQALVGSHYALLSYERDFLPNPDYYVALLWTRYMGPEVLGVQGNTDDLHVYAARNGSDGAVAVAWANVDETNGYSVALACGGGGCGGRRRLEWHVTAPALTSRDVLLNGERLASVVDGPPPLPGKHADASKPLEIAPLSWGIALLLKD